MKRQMILAILLAAGNALAVEISGTITSTLSITEDSWLTGNVRCQVQGAPCIRVDAPNISLWLLGYSITGLANPPSGCAPPGDPGNGENGIQIGNGAVGHRRVEVLGPGLVQNFRGQGLLIRGTTTRATVKDITFSSNCWSGILLNSLTSDNDIEGNVCSRNGNRYNPCGGICIFNSHNNRVRHNVTSGNGYAITSAPGLLTFANFGIGLEGTSRGNMIEKNTASGNVNGIYLEPGVANNVVFQNILIGNPPIQISESIDGFPGFDIRNFAPEIANTFVDNICVTYSGAGPAVCPGGTKMAGR